MEGQQRSPYVGRWRMAFAYPEEAKAKHDLFEFAWAICSTSTLTLNADGSYDFENALDKDSPRKVGTWTVSERVISFQVDESLRGEWAGPFHWSAELSDDGKSFVDESGGQKEHATLFKKDVDGPRTQEAITSANGSLMAGCAAGMWEIDSKKSPFQVRFMNAQVQLELPAESDYEFKAVRMWSFGDDLVVVWARGDDMTNLARFTCDGRTIERTFFGVVEGGHSDISCADGMVHLHFANGSVRTIDTAADSEEFVG